MTKYFAVALQQNRMVSIKASWIQNPKIGGYSKIFIAPNEEAIANFSLRTDYLLNTNKAKCYHGRVIKSFDNKNEADKFISWKRPQYFRSGKFHFDKATTVAKFDVSNSRNNCSFRLQ